MSKLIPYRKETPDNNYGSWGFCTQDKKEVVPYIFQLVHPFSEGFAAIYPGDCVTVEGENKFGFINEKGKHITDCLFDSVRNFSEGMAAVCLSGIWGAINHHGILQVSPFFRDLRCYSEGLAAAQLFDLDRLYEIRDIYEKDELNTTFDDNETEDVQNENDEEDEFKNNENERMYINAHRKFKLDYHRIIENFECPKYSGKKWGYIDHRGEQTIPFIYDKVSSFSEGYAAVELNGKWGFINKHGLEIIPFIYESAGNFSEGLAAVVLSGKLGFIDNQGKVVIPFEYDPVEMSIDPAIKFSEGLANVPFNNRWGFIDQLGKTIIPFEYTRADCFSEGLAAVHFYGKDKCDRFYNYDGYEIGGFDYVAKKGVFINRDNNIVIDGNYDEIRSFSCGLAKVRLNERDGYIDSNGTQFWEDDFYPEIDTSLDIVS